MTNTTLTLIMLAFTFYSCESNCIKTIKKYENGQSSIIREYPNCKDSLTYTEKRFHTNGELGNKVVIDKNKEAIELYSYNNRGILITKWAELNGEAHGIFTWFYDSGELWRKMKYQNGIQNGFHREWYKNGQLAAQGKYDNCIKDSIWNYWFDNGDTLLIESYANGLLHGPYTLFDTLGGYTKSNYDKGELNGATYEFTIKENGDTITVKGNYKNGLLHGAYTITNGYGGYSKLNYDNGKLDGPAYEFNIRKNGDTTIVKGNYLDGLEDGAWIFFNTKNEPFDTIYYVNGKSIK